MAVAVDIAATKDKLDVSIKIPETPYDASPFSALLAHKRSVELMQKRGRWMFSFTSSMHCGVV